MLSKLINKIINHKTTEKTQYIINVLSSFIPKAIIAFTSFWIPPLILKSLGVSSFGLIGISMSVVAYAAIMSNSLNLSLGRHFTIHFVNHEKDKCQEYLNSSVKLLVVVLSVIVVSILLTADKIAVLIVDEAVLQYKFTHLIRILILGFAMEAFSGLTAVGFYVKKRYDLQNMAAAVSRVVFLAALITGFKTLGISLYVYGMAYLLDRTVYLVITFMLFNKLLPGFKLTGSKCSKEVFRENAGFAGWITFNSIGSVLLLYSDNLILTFLINPAAVGIYNLAHVWNKFARQASMVLNTPLSPIITADVGRGDVKKTNDVLFKFMRFNGWIFGPAIGVLYGFSNIILKLWLGDVPEDLPMALYFLTIPLIFTLPQNPIFFIANAWGYVKYPAILNLIAAVLNIIFDYIFIRYFGWGILGAAIPTSILLALKNTVFLPLFLAKKKVLDYKNFLKALVPGAVLVLAFGALSGVIYSTVNPQNFLTLLGCLAAVAVVYAPAMWFLGLEKPEKEKLLNFIKKLIKKVKKDGNSEKTG